MRKLNKECFAIAGSDAASVLKDMVNIPITIEHRHECFLVGGSYDGQKRTLPDSTMGITVDGFRNGEFTSEDYIRIKPDHPAFILKGMKKRPLIIQTSFTRSDAREKPMGAMQDSGDFGEADRLMAQILAKGRKHER